MVREGQLHEYYCYRRNQTRPEGGGREVKLVWRDGVVVVEMERGREGVGVGRGG